MKRYIGILVLLALIACAGSISAQKKSHSHVKFYSTSKPHNSLIYNLGGTRYRSGENYPTTGKPKVQRSMTARNQFLKNQGYRKIPYGYEVDHIIPLSKGGQDIPSNMQLLPKQVHKQKTASERARK